MLSASLQPPASATHSSPNRGKAATAAGAPDHPRMAWKQEWGLQRQGEVVQSPASSPHLPPGPAPDTQPLSKPGPWDWLSRALGPRQQAEG